MRHKLIVRRRRADEDIEAAIAYYLNEAGSEVALDFANQLQESLQKISVHPRIGSPRYGDIARIPNLRHWPIKNFPYLAFYVEKENRIELVRVLHGGMDIPSWIDDLE